MKHFVSEGKPIPKITCKTDYRDIRIYIVMPRPNVDNESRDSMRLQSYFVGSRKAKRYFIELKSGNYSDYYGYDNFEIWKKILSLLDEHI